jgi:hypothetical protein
MSVKELVGTTRSFAGSALHVMLGWLLALVSSLGIDRSEIVGRSVQGIGVVKMFPVPFGIQLHGLDASFSSEITRNVEPGVTGINAGPIPKGLACVCKFEGRQHTSISLRYDFPELTEAVVRSRVPWLLRLGEELYKGYQAHGVAYLQNWKPRRFEDEFPEGA